MLINVAGEDDQIPFILKSILSEYSQGSDVYGL